ncbi:hypothetical protein [Hahella ganghwensis]|uniref:hypothetical protein n=1 Tax=Hahella ganghwensis TaxID=286420 RepID=UPI00035DB773|nr:hypothetical protein [Hahella ganghwensis]
MPTTTQNTDNSVKPTGYQATQAQAGQYTGAQGEASSYEGAQGNAATYEANTGTASSYEADQREVNPYSTVSGQLTGLLSQDNPYMKRAEQNALRTANSRGLLNSTMAVGAAHGAAIDAALPIAQQDAATYHDQSKTNQAYSNQSLQYNATNEQNMTLANMDATNTASQFNSTNEQNMNLANMDSQNQANQFNASNEQNMTQANMDSENQANQFNAQQQSATSLANAGMENEANQFNQAMQADFYNQDQQRMHADYMAKLDYQIQSGLLDKEVASNLRGQYLKNMENTLAGYAQDVKDIMTDPNIKASDRQKLIDQVIAMRDADIQFTQSLYSAQPMWTNNFGQSPLPSIAA